MRRTQLQKSANSKRSTENIVTMLMLALRGLAGAAIGTALGCLALLALPAAQAEGGFLTGLGFQGWHWLWPLAIPPLAGAVALLATRAAARRRLEDMP